MDVAERVDRATVEERPRDSAVAYRTPDLRRHMPVLDGIRGLAVLMVLVFHFVGPIAPSNAFEGLIIKASGYGAYGVELFFVLSGFLITGILYDSTKDPHYFRNFYIRRCLRIFPLYYGVLIMTFWVAPLIPAFRGPTLDYLVSQQWWAWLYGVNIHIALHGDWSYSYLQHFWSLAVEEHFYLFWPFVVYALRNNIRALIGVSMAIAALAIVARFVGFLMGLSWWSIVVLTPFRLDGLAIGAAIALIARLPDGFDLLRRAIPATLVGTAALYVVTLVFKGPVLQNDVSAVVPIRSALIQIFLAGLIILALTLPAKAWVVKVFSSRFMCFFGTYSYGLYVYHHFFSYYFERNKTLATVTDVVGSYQLAILLQVAFGFLASLAVAYASYELFERRVLQLKSRWAPHPSHRS